MRSLFLYVALGSAAGGVSRFALATLVQSRVATPFPWGTLLVNVTGSLILGFVLRYALQTPAISPEVRALLTTGFCGGYTTFSTFSYETATLIEEGGYQRAVLYVLASVLVSLAAIFLGLAAADALVGTRRAL
ncbi:MAG: fluoride efflux transporter CrcB [Gemmatimonadaceae bacterium]|nr:fluoride efflux transporter CrcB [Gemmatimonadaceae bacterium]NUQ91682.1 fluoride efflux transporter CrcB [Gemmatimonadaceae bacterium]NUR19302.1 fluoride efflux transporter CrcB [Gemmatimonadaceae bacterium]NUS97687.1 fluoride efflux transporter CrcB [Gemmatimonadaceae bacterium]